MISILEQIKSYRIIPVVELPSVDQAHLLAQALLEGGLPIMEITFRTAAALEALRVISTQFPEILLGAGTVLTISQADQAFQMGAKFIVSPGIHPELVAWCLNHDVLPIPGVATPSEIMMALYQGLTTLKFFPAQALGGVGTLKALCAPFKQIYFIPTGGISPQNLSDYLGLPNVIACGGSWMVTPSLLKPGKYGEITKLVKSALEIVASTRNSGGLQ